MMNERIQETTAAMATLVEHKSEIFPASLVEPVRKCWQ